MKTSYCLIALTILLLISSHLDSSNEIKPSEPHCTDCLVSKEQKKTTPKQEIGTKQPQTNDNQTDSEQLLEVYKTHRKALEEGHILNSD